MSTLQDIFSMQDKVCVITGGSRGLGYYMAKGFFAAGAKRVYITARKADACNAAAEELSQYGECISLPGDISTMEEIQSLANTLKERESSIDVLVNNAGRGWLEPLESFPEMGWDKVMDLNVKSPFFLTRELVPLLEAGATPALPIASDRPRARPGSRNGKRRGASHRALRGFRGTSTGIQSAER